MPDESPRAHFDRLKKQLQDSILQEYPNPERKGCPGNAVLHDLARLPLDQNVESNANWEHVTHCSECYREFLDIRAVMIRRQKTKRVSIGLGSVAAILIIAAAVVLTNRRSGAPA